VIRLEIINQGSFFGIQKVRDLMATVYLSLGGNMGDRDQYLAGARDAIQTAFPGVPYEC